MPRGFPTSEAEETRFDVAVVGAGASGLLAASRAAERGRATVLLEKNARPGAKLLISGGGRCNLTHACDERGIAAAFGAAGRFLRSPLAAFGPTALIDWLREEGVTTYVEPGGKIFPATDRAADVLDALLARLKRSGAQLAANEPVEDIRRLPEGFQI
ncbi:MAG: FAD-dependent oxidoreductase, partial [Patescibacteria group bacterium]|nr:FAD-dependent oxidoreductase [Patescibacteria group bacterium]